MWCCKRLDASDWPVTTVVRGNVSCVCTHRVAAAVTAAVVSLVTFKTPGDPCSRGFLLRLFSFFSPPPSPLSLSLSLSLCLDTTASSASEHRCFFCRTEKETRDKEAQDSPRTRTCLRICWRIPRSMMASMRNGISRWWIATRTVARISTRGSSREDCFKVWRSISATRARVRRVNDR